jgi:hypothetical protein
MLDNREIALLVWLSIGLIWLLSYRQMHASLWGLVKSVLKLRLVVGFLLMLCYVTSCVLLLWHLDIWNQGSLKPTLLWGFSAALVMVWKVVSDGTSPTKFFRQAVWGGIKVSLLLEFVVQLYVLPLLFEMFFIPIAVIIVTLLAYCEMNPQHESVKRLLNRMLATFGFIILGYAIYRLGAGFSEFWQISTVLSFLLPIVLTVLFVPFLWLVAVAVAYENVFCRLRFFVEDPKLQAFVRRQMYWNFGLRFNEVNRWWTVYMRERPQTKNEFKDTMICARFNE